MAARITLKSALSDIISGLSTLDEESCEDRFKVRNKIWRRAGWIYENAIDIRVEVANNEKKKYTSKEISFDTIPMRTKAETGERQTADYVFYWKFKFEPEEAFRKMGICFERKEVKDFHGTIIQNYERFDREIDRFLQDPKTKMMLILIEGSLQETLAYIPPKIYSGDAVKGMISSKLGAIASIEARGVHVCFKSSRTQAANSMKKSVEHFWEKNIEFVLRNELKEIEEHGIGTKYTEFISVSRDDGTSAKPAKQPTKKRSNVKSGRTYRPRSSKTKK
ncbi:MAG: ERCC4 domain-containing protein [Candidatus Pacebacteria bacterium]|nr:ERCC4 domain-containing protein [Fermentimonas sp.]MDD4804423.1 ERCC4 domain-containing protein [Candidatus Paceibacterota bacterium]